MPAEPYVHDEIRLGSFLLTVVEPHKGHEVAYNRWYERDHFYSGCMIGPWNLTGGRFVATRDCKARRQPADSPGSYMALYWVQDGKYKEWVEWAGAQVGWLHKNGRMFEERDHIHTQMYKFRGAVARDPDPRPAGAGSRPPLSRAWSRSSAKSTRAATRWRRCSTCRRWASASSARPARYSRGRRRPPGRGLGPALRPPLLRRARSRSRRGTPTSRSAIGDLPGVTLRLAVPRHHPRHRHLYRSALVSLASLTGGSTPPADHGDADADQSSPTMPRSPRRSTTAALLVSSTFPGRPARSHCTVSVNIRRERRADDERSWQSGAWPPWSGVGAGDRSAPQRRRRRHGAWRRRPSATTPTTARRTRARRSRASWPSRRSPPGDTINVAAGTYIDRFTITKAVTINGAGQASTIINGNAAGSANQPVVTVNATPNTSLVTINGVTIRGGQSHFGAGLSVFNGTTVVNDSTITANRAQAVTCRPSRHRRRRCRRARAVLRRSSST